MPRADVELGRPVATTPFGVDADHARMRYLPENGLDLRTNLRHVWRHCEPPPSEIVQLMSSQRPGRSSISRSISPKTSLASLGARWLWLPCFTIRPPEGRTAGGAAVAGGKGAAG